MNDIKYQALVYNFGEKKIKYEEIEGVKLNFYSRKYKRDLAKNKERKFELREDSFLGGNTYKECIYITDIKTGIGIGIRTLKERKLLNEFINVDDKLKEIKEREKYKIEKEIFTL
jgi:hypothetical protein